MIFDLLSRKEQTQKLTLRHGILLTIEEWIKEEGKFMKEKLEKLKSDLQQEDIEFREFGENRYFVEYYDGILIFTDNLCWAKSNVISIEKV